jgi:septin family protein
MLSMRNNRSTAIFGRSYNPPAGYIVADVRKKSDFFKLKKILFQMK